MAAYTKPLPVPDIDSQVFWDGCKAHELSAAALPRLREHFAGRLKPFVRIAIPGNSTGRSSRKPGPCILFVVVHYVSIPCFSGRRSVRRCAYQRWTAPTGRYTMISNVIGCPAQDVRVGMPVRVVFEDVTPEVTLPKFRPR